MARFTVALAFAAVTACAASSGEERQLGSHQMLLCEVALGKGKLHTAPEKGKASASASEWKESLRGAGFDSTFHQPSSERVGAEEWVVYNELQAIPAFLISYDVQPRAVAARLLAEMKNMEERRRQLDAQMAHMLQELEQTRRDAEATRLELDEQLARQLMNEEQLAERAERDQRDRREKLDAEQASQMQELEKAKQEVERMKAQIKRMEQGESSGAVVGRPSSRAPSPWPWAGPPRYSTHTATSMIASISINIQLNK